jgi:hypothetical protein
MDTSDMGAVREVVTAESVNVTVRAESAGPDSPITQTLRDVNVHIIQQFTQSLLRSEAAPRGDLDPLRGSYARPPQYIQASEILRTRHVVVLVGSRGTGRRSGGLRLLLDYPEVSIHDLATDGDRPSVSRLPSEPRQGYLLDLTDEEAAIPEAFGSRVADHGEGLAQSGSYLVITVTDDLWQSCRASTYPISTQFGLPSAREVVEKRLMYLSASPERLAALNEPAIAALVSEAARPVELVELARSLYENDGLNLEDIADEYHRWKDYLNGWFASGEVSVSNRALLISAAVLEGAPAGVIMDAADKLLKEARAPVSQDGPLAGDDLSLRIKKIDAVLRNDGGVSINKKHRRLDHAVMDHIWVERPQLREPLLAWMADIAGANGVASKHAERVAMALAELAVSQSTDIFLDVIDKWLQSDENRYRIAVSVLERTALSPTVGASVRARLRRWVENQRTNERTLRAVAEVCGGQLGEQRPKVALHRLKLIIGRGSEDAEQSAAMGLRRLASVASVRRVVLATVLDWTRSGADLQAGCVGFLGLVDLGVSDSCASLLLEDTLAFGGEQVRQLLVSGWVVTLRDKHTEGRAVELLNGWVDEAATTETGKRTMYPIVESVLKDLSVRSKVAPVLIPPLATDPMSEERQQIRTDLLRSMLQAPHDSIRQAAADY